MQYNFINPKILIIQGNKKNKKVKSAMFDAFVIAFPRSFLFPAHSAGQLAGLHLRLLFFTGKKSHFY